MGIYMEDVSAGAIFNENDLKASAVYLYDFCDRIVDFSDEAAAKTLSDASNGVVNVDRSLVLATEVFKWMEDNYEGYEDIVGVADRVRRTGILSEDKS